MKITITVSDKLFRKDTESCFQDFFKRVIADIADSLNNGSTGLCGRYELETAVLLQNAFAHGQYLEDVLTAEITELEDKHGHWVNETYCSVCGRFPVDVSESISNRRLTKFFEWCPHCGAKLDGGENDE